MGIDKDLISANSGIALPDRAHVFSTKVGSMTVEAQSQCQQRAKTLAMDFESAHGHSGFQAAAAVTFQNLELAKADNCAAAIRVFNQS